MLISISLNLISTDNNKNLLIYPGERLPDNFLFKNTKLYLSPGVYENDCKQEKKININIDSYYINNKKYTLTDSYKLEVFIRNNNFLTPVLRNAYGEEKNIYKTRKGNQRQFNKLSGEDNPYWPKIIKNEFKENV